MEIEKLTEIRNALRVAHEIVSDLHTIVGAAGKLATAEVEKVIVFAHNEINEALTSLSAPKKRKRRSDAKADSPEDTLPIENGEDTSKGEEAH